MRVRSRHGHYANTFEEEAKRIQKMYKDKLNIDITYVEATAIAAERSLSNFWNDKQLKDVIMKLRGLY